MTHEETPLKGRHALVTGGGQGIGAAIAMGLAQLGAAVTITGRTVATLERQAQMLRTTHGDGIAAIRCDVTDEKSVRDAFADARRKLGPISILINNAGEAPSARFTDTTKDMWDRTVAVNLTGAYLCTAQVVNEMVEAGWGRIVNMASTAGLRGYNRTAAYCASKHGVVGLTRALSLEFAKVGVTVNAVCPGYVSTRIVDDAIRNVSEGMQKTPEEAREILLRTIPRRQFTTPEEVASLVGWLCSEEASAVTGAAIPVAGGEVV
jgi:NAD(P)-dependent dehydrogenase (short-subunit alcohol dehydrogenase family)